MKKTRLKLIVAIVIIFIGIFSIVLYSLKKKEYAIPDFSDVKWYREVYDKKEYIVFNKDNSFEYYDEENNNIIDDDCNKYKFNKYTNEISIICKDSSMIYKVIKYKEDKLDLKFDTGDVREFKLEDSDNE